MPNRYLPKWAIKLIAGTICLLLVGTPAAAYAAPSLSVGLPVLPESAPQFDATDLPVSLRTSDAAFADFGLAPLDRPIDTEDPIADADPNNPRDAQALIQLGIQPYEACTDGQMQARQDVNGTMWLAGGCLFGLLAVGGAYLIEPSPPASALVGKDAQYVAQYTDCYEDAGKDIQTKNALYGCLIGTGVSTVLYIALIAAAATSDVYYY